MKGFHALAGLALLMPASANAAVSPEEANDICRQTEALATKVMDLRQAGGTLSEAMTVASKVEADPRMHPVLANGIIRRMVRAAYDLPIQADGDYKREASRQFAEEFAGFCYDGVAQVEKGNDLQKADRIEKE